MFGGGATKVDNAVAVLGATCGRTGFPKIVQTYAVNT